MTRLSHAFRPLITSNPLDVRPSILPGGKYKLMATKVARAREAEIPDIWKTLNVAERLSERRVGKFPCFSDFLHPLIVRPSYLYL